MHPMAENPLPSREDRVLRFSFNQLSNLYCFGGSDAAAICAMSSNFGGASDTAA